MEREYHEFSNGANDLKNLRNSLIRVICVKNLHNTYLE